MKIDPYGYPPRLLHPPDAARYVGGLQMLERLKEFGLKPSRQAKSSTLYLKDELDKAINEAHAAEWGDGRGSKTPHHALKQPKQKTA